MRYPQHCPVDTFDPIQIKHKFNNQVPVTKKKHAIESTLACF